MAARKASEGIAEVIKQTAGPKVQSKVTVDQVYAHYQHEVLYFRHPRGGMAKYLEVPLFAEHDVWLEEFALGLLNIEERAAHRWGRVTGDAMVHVVEVNAPDEFGDLRRSAALEVREGGKVIINKPAAVHRLTEAELDEKDDLRDLLGLRDT